MAVVSQIARWEIEAFLFGLAALVALKLLTGEINTRYLLWGTLKNGQRYFSPERVQLLGLTLATAFNLVLQVLQNPSANQFPAISERWVMLFGSSHGIYLAGKSWALMGTDAGPPPGTGGNDNA